MAITHTVVPGDENEVYRSLKETVDRETEVSGVQCTALGNLCNILCSMYTYIYT